MITQQKRVLELEKLMDEKYTGLLYTVLLIEHGKYCEEDDAVLTMVDLSWEGVLSALLICLEYPHFDQDIHSISIVIKGKAHNDNTAETSPTGLPETGD